MIPAVGRSTPVAASTAFTADASSTPATKPSADATTPTSERLEQHRRTTCPPLAPMARSSAISRLRWAMMIQNVLKMMNEPTSSAITPKTRRNVLKNAERAP